MHAYPLDGIRVPYHGPGPTIRSGASVRREVREEFEEVALVEGATRALGAGRRAVPETPDAMRTCFERDRDRILHASAFRRLAGKTQVFIFPSDHQRTRLTHALEVAQVARSVAAACGLNEALTEAIALGHDCGHGPGGHASEDALTPYLTDGFEHGPWGADEVLASLNLCAETLDGIRNHSWSRPTPATPEALVVRWADRIAYCCHDLEDAASAGVVDPTAVPPSVAEVLGIRRSNQLRTLVEGLVETITSTGRIALSDSQATALGDLRGFNHEHIYLRAESLRQGRSVVRVLQALVEHAAQNPLVMGMPAARELDADSAEALRAAVRWVAGMTDRFACDQAVHLLDWPTAALPAGLGLR